MRRRFLRPLPLFLPAGLLLAVMAACSGAPEGPAVVVRDSAGVAVVENVRPAWGRGEGWEVAPDPELRVGAADGDPAAQLAQVVGVARLEGGGLAVADAGSQEVHFFGPRGRHRSTVGGTGAGPGEFTGLAALGPAPGGGVWAYDFPLRRITWLGPGGGVERLERLGPEPPMLEAVGALPDRTLVLRELWGGAAPGAATAGLGRDSIAYVLHDGSGAAVDTLGLFPGTEAVVGAAGGRVARRMPPFGRRSVAAVREGGVVIGSQARWELEEYRPDGTLERRILLPTQDLEIDADDREAWVETYAEAVPRERRAAIRAALRDLPAPETRPAYGDLLADAAGNLWVGEYAVFGEVPSSWQVLDPSGRWLGTVELPEGLRPLAVGRDWIAGVERSEQDVEQVVVYPVTKPGGNKGAGGEEPNEGT